MKNQILVFAGLCLFGFAASACPDLSGSFTYDLPGQGPTELSISQEVRSDITYYSFSFGENEVPADNVTYNLPDSAQLKDATQRAYCDGDVFHETLTGKLYDENENYFGELMNDDVAWSLDQTGDVLIYDASGFVRTPNGDKDLLDVSCTRN